jgi:hypothetical protein
VGEWGIGREKEGKRLVLRREWVFDACYCLTIVVLGVVGVVVVLLVARVLGSYK